METSKVGKSPEKLRKEIETRTHRVEIIKNRMSHKKLTYGPSRRASMQQLIKRELKVIETLEAQLKEL